jgi:undecaprenyl-diphosphatase
MGWIQGIILGMVQGLTEFLPISSSGHLVLFQNLLGLKEPEVFFDICLHVGTLLAICIFFFQDLRDISADIFTIPRRLRRGESFREQWRTRPVLRLAFFVLIGTIPTVIIGVAISTISEICFSSIRCVGLMLVTTGIILALTKRFQKGGRDLSRFNVWDALLIGMTQGLAVLPGISRSGATISMGLFAGLDREIAGRYSFILSIPAILGALLMKWEFPLQGSVPASVLLVGTLVATLIGYASLKILMWILKKGEFFFFAPYCWVVGAVAIGLSF